MKVKKIKTKAEIKPSDDNDAYLIDADEKNARAIIASLKDKPFSGKIGVFGRDNEFNRRALETLKIDYLVSPELGDKRDTLKQRDSGLNHVLAKIAKNKNISIIIDFSDLKKMENKKQKALRISRIIQNIKICRKAGCKILILEVDNKLNKKELKSFGFSLGMSSQQASAMNDS